MQLDIMRGIQSLSNPVLDLVMEAVTMLGESVVLAGIFCAVYWCINKDLGRWLAIALCGSLAINGVVKDLVRAPRPFDEAGLFLLRVETATGYSFPSAHSQTSSVFWLTVALWVKRKWVWWCSILLILGVGISRLYLGVHYPVDVLGGWTLGIIVAVVFYLPSQVWTKANFFAGAKENISQKAASAFALVVCLVAGILAVVLGESDDTLSAVGMLFGLFFGLWLEASAVNFTLEGLSVRRRVLRFGGGVALMGVLYLLLGLLLPDTALVGAVRYGLIVFFAIGGYPWLFNRLKL